MRIEHITCYEVKVPAKPGTVDSESINKPLHQLPLGAKAGLPKRSIPEFLVPLRMCPDEDYTHNLRNS